jgi:2-polyprenyl-3-methyl-5-hydroxy-6-metoxy-1,4-benzoquinol methylase
MNWEETILHVRSLPEFEEAVFNTYLGADAKDSVERYRKSAEFIETKNKIEHYLGKNKLSIVDVGAGNGITTIALALEGHDVIALEPDPSNIIGAGVIAQLVKQYQLNNVEIVVDICENLVLAEEVDLVISRQAMHHANNLNQYLNSMSKCLRKGGLAFTIRDHVLLNSAEKPLFLDRHPLHKFYGGENAYTLEQYNKGFQNANLEIKEVLSYFESIINFFPMTIEEKDEKKEKRSAEIRKAFVNKFGSSLQKTPIFLLYKYLFDLKYGKLFDEKDYVGRPYSFLAVKS